MVCQRLKEEAERRAAEEAARVKAEKERAEAEEAKVSPGTQ